MTKCLLFLCKVSSTQKRIKNVNDVIVGMLEGHLEKCGQLINLFGGYEVEAL